MVDLKKPKVNYVITPFPFRKNLQENKSEVKLEKIQGEDYLSENFGKFQLKFGPFADLPIFPEAYNKMFKIVFEFNQQPLREKNCVIDFDCNSGIYGVKLGHKSNRIIGLDSASVHLENAKINADLQNIANDYRLGADVENLNRIFEDLHYENRNATVLLHPKPGAALPDGIIKSIIDCAQVKNVILFASYPEIEAFQALSLFLKPSGSKQDQKRRFRLNKQLLFEMFPHKMSRLQYVYCLYSK